MRSFQRKPDNRRSVYLKLAGQIESKLRGAFAKRHEQKRESQASIARKIGVNRSAVNRRLTGQTNMTIETIADMVWSLGYCIDVDIYDPEERRTNGHQIVPDHDSSPLMALFADPQNMPDSQKPKFDARAESSAKLVVLPRSQINLVPIP